MSLLTSTEDLAAACARLAQHPFVTVDTEFLRETTFWPKVCVIQLASPDEAFAVDTLAEGLDLSPFFELMADEKRRQGLPRGAPGPRDRLAARPAHSGAAVRHAGRGHGLRLRRSGLLCRAGQGHLPGRASTNPRASPIGRGGRCRRRRSNTPSPTSPICGRSTRICARGSSAPTGSTGSPTRCAR